MTVQEKKSISLIQIKISNTIQLPDIVTSNMVNFGFVQQSIMLLLLLLQVASVMSDSVRPHRRQPTGLCRPWDSPGKNTGVGCHFLLQCIKVKGESEVAQSCPTLSDPMDCSLPGSSVHGIFQARVLEWGAIAFSVCYAIDGNKSCFQLIRQEYSI